jgi:lipopolysaccharide export system protein LptA
MSKTHNNQILTKSILALSAVFAVIFLLSSLVHAAEKAEPKPPIDITSDSLEATGNDIIFIGNVHAVYGDMTIDADRVQLFYESEKSGGPEKKQEIKTIIATGNVELIEKNRHAWAGKMVYERAKELATLTEKPRIRQETNTITGKVIRVFLDEDRVKAEGDVKVIVNSDTSKE